MVKDSKRGVKDTVFIEKVQKRNGSIAPFDFSRIVNALFTKRCLLLERGLKKKRRSSPIKFWADLVRIVKKFKNFVPTVEGIQDTA